MRESTWVLTYSVKAKHDLQTLKEVNFSTSEPKEWQLTDVLSQLGKHLSGPVRKGVCTRTIDKCPSCGGLHRGLIGEYCDDRAKRLRWRFTCPTTGRRQSLPTKHTETRSEGPGDYIGSLILSSPGVDTYRIVVCSGEVGEVIQIGMQQWWIVNGETFFAKSTRFTYAEQAPSVALQFAQYSGSFGNIEVISPDDAEHVVVVNRHANPTYSIG